MKSFVILDREDTEIGVLLYYEKAKDFIIELSGDLDEWTAPLLFASLVKKGVYTVPRELCRLWVKERIIPEDRQNIARILANHKLSEYDEMKLLVLSDGKCAQDEMYIRKLDAIPEYVSERRKKNVRECFITEDDRLICFFEDDSARRIDLKDFAVMEEVKKVLDNPMLLHSCAVGTGGYSITFDNAIDIPAWMLHDAGECIPLRLSDFTMFIERNTLDTAESCGKLACSRQNLSYLVRRGELTPIKEEIRGNLYLKGDVIRSGW